jgi:hypothetical protein
MMMCWGGEMKKHKNNERGFLFSKKEKSNLKL